MQKTERVTDEMVEAASRAMCVEGGFDPDERMPNDGPRWNYYCDGARAALTAALSSAEEKAVEVNIKPLEWENADGDGTMSFRP